MNCKICKQFIKNSYNQEAILSNKAYSSTGSGNFIDF